MQTQTQKRKINTMLVLAPFDRAIAQLNDEGYKPASLKDAAQARIQQGAKAEVSTNGFYVAESVLYIPGKGNYLVPANYSPILASPSKATNAHRSNREFYVPQERAEEIVQNSIAFPTKNIEVPTNRLGEEELFAKSMGEDTAREYGEFLKQEAGIGTMPVIAVPQDYVSKQRQPFARQPWLRSLDDRSGLGGDIWDRVLYLGCDSRVLGVHGKTGGASRAQKLSYNAKQLDKIQALISGVREGTLPASKLERALEFLNSLRAK